MGDTMSRQKYTMTWSPSQKSESVLGSIGRYILSSASACLAEIEVTKLERKKDVKSTYPLDLIKTRRHIQLETKRYDAVLHRHSRQGIRAETSFEMIKNILKKEGVTKLWEGGSPAVIRQIGFAGTRVTVYEELREILGKNEDGSFDVWKAIPAGLIGGAVAQFIVSPIDLIKIQLQVEGQRRQEGRIPRVKGIVHAIKKIVARNGLQGLWAGWRPNIHMAALANMASLGSYDIIKHNSVNFFALQDNFIIQSISSLSSSLILATLVVPPDMIKTRMLNQPRDSIGRGLLYTTTLDCFLKVAKNEGLTAFYSGFWPFYVRLVPWTWIFWLSYETSRRLFGTEAF